MDKETLQERVKSYEESLDLIIKEATTSTAPAITVVERVKKVALETKKEQNEIMG